MIGQTKYIYSGTMAGVDINTLTIEQYLALSREKQAPGVVKPEIGGNVNFEIKSQFMRELRKETFSKNKNEDAHDHVDRVLNIVSLFSTREVTQVALLLRVFPFTLTRTAKRWVYRLTPGTVNTWDLFERAFIQRMTPTQALTTMQTMVDHSQKWHDRTSSRIIDSNSNTDGLAAIVRKLDNLGRDMKKLKENVHAIQVEEAKYGEFRHPAPFNGCNEAKYRVGPPGYYTRIDNRPPYGEKRPSLEELMNKHQEESIRRSAEMNEWIKKLQESVEINTRNQSVSLKNLETQIKQLTQELHSRATDETPSSSTRQCKVVNVDHETPSELNNLHGVYFLPNSEEGTTEDRQEQQVKNVKAEEYIPIKHLCKPIVQTYNGKVRMWPTRDPDKSICGGGVEIYKRTRVENLRIWDKVIQNEALNLDKDPMERSFDDYKWVFDLEIEQLADEYELGIGKKGHILEMIRKIVRMSK
ncbi:hypothetical protein Tco_1035939, partial [Tanacetum coccineum]